MRWLDGITDAMDMSLKPACACGFMLCNQRSHRNEEQALFTTTRESPVSGSEDPMQAKISINE